MAHDREGCISPIAGDDTPGFSRWIFFPGMLFGSDVTWWAGTGIRKSPHEGVDFLYYTDNDANAHRIRSDASVCAIADGIIDAIIEDFLGSTIIVRSRNPEDNAVLLYLYAHTMPVFASRPGRVVRAGEVMASLAPLRRPAAGLAPHLHLSVARLVHDISAGLLRWETISRDPSLELMDPLGYLSCPYGVLSMEKIVPGDLRV